MITEKEILTTIIDKVPVKFKEYFNKIIEAIINCEDYVVIDYKDYEITAFLKFLESFGFIDNQVDDDSVTICFY